MSRRKKKLRNPSPEAVADYAKRREEQIAKQKADDEAQRRARAEAPLETKEADPGPQETPAQRRRREDAEHFASLSSKEQETWAVAGRIIHKRLSNTYLLQEGDVTEDEVVESLNKCTRFLSQLVEAASDVMQMLDTKTVRSIVAADVPLSGSTRLALLAIGVEIDEPEPPNCQSSSPQKRPRGSRHPLMAFFSLAVQASRLLHQITRGVWPHAHNQLTRQEREERFVERQSDSAKADRWLQKLSPTEQRRGKET